MIKIEPFSRKDFDKLISWVDSEETLVGFAGTFFTYPLTQQQLELYLEDKDRFAYKVVDKGIHSTIGHAEIYFTNKTAVLCRILIGDSKYRGQGRGHQIVDQLLEYSFTTLEAEKAELNVFDWNTSAIKCYGKAGFTINAAKTKKREVNGKTWIALNMTINKTDWIDKANKKGDKFQF